MSTSNSIDLEARLNARSSTPSEERNRCPECEHLNIEPHVNGTYRGKKYLCNICGNHFDDPLTGVSPEGQE